MGETTEIKWSDWTENELACIRAGGDLQVVLHEQRAPNPQGGAFCTRYVVTAFDSDGNPVRRIGIFTSFDLASTMFSQCVELARESCGPPRPRTEDACDLVAWTIQAPGEEQWEWAGGNHLDETLGDGIGVRGF